MDIIYFESISSTNSALIEASKKSAKSWTIYWTTNQTQGRGYAGNVWEAKVNENLAFSLLINSDLDYVDLVGFNQWVSVVLCKYFLTLEEDVFVKWPNDIIIKNKKVCGVLIETYKSVNQLNIVVGVGVNVNQNDFHALPKAGSLFTQTERKFEIKEILSDLLTAFQNEFHFIEKKQWNLISEMYNSHLFRKGIESKFKIGEEEISGIIENVNENGDLEVKFQNGEIKTFKTKEIELIF